MNKEKPTIYIRENELGGGLKEIRGYIAKESKLFLWFEFDAPTSSSPEKEAQVWLDNEEIEEEYNLILI